MQYGLDKPIVLRYLIWLGVFPKEYKSKTISIGKSFRESVDNVSVSQFKNYLLQRYVRVEIDENQDYQIIETGVGLEFPLPSIDKLNIETHYDDFVNLEVLDASGRLILKKDFFKATNIDLSDFAQGVYSVNFITNQGRLTKNILVE